jgi:hypothetical protein
VKVLDATVEDDPEAVDLVASLKADFEVRANEVVGQCVAGGLSPGKMLLLDTPPLFAACMVAAATEAVAMAAEAAQSATGGCWATLSCDSGPAVCLLNRNAIGHMELSAGDIRRSDLKTLFPFNNVVLLGTVSGRCLRALALYNVYTCNLPVSNNAVFAVGFDYVVRYRNRFCGSSDGGGGDGDSGEVVTAAHVEATGFDTGSVTLDERTMSVGGEPLDDSDVYRVVVDDFLAYTVLADVFADNGGFRLVHSVGANFETLVGGYLARGGVLGSGYAA